MSKMQKLGFIFFVFIYLLVAGALLGRSDITDSCNETGTFTHLDVTYNCQPLVEEEVEHLENH